MKQRIKISAFLGILLIVSLFLMSCGDSKTASLTETKTEGTGGLGVTLKWEDGVGKAAVPSGVATVRISISAPDMTTITKDFSVSSGGGIINAVPAGTNRTVSAYGLDSAGKVLYRGGISGVTITGGTTTTVVITMLFAEGSPTATLTADITNGTAPLSVTFTVGYTDPEAQPGTYLLDYGDGSAKAEGSINSGGTTTKTHTYSTSGSYTATLTVTDDGLNQGIAILGITLTGPDTTPPTVSSTSPCNNATGVAVNTAISATFSEAMNASTITTATFTLTGASSVSGTVSYSGTTATFTPSSNLANSTTYTATVTTDAKDSAGNAMASNYTWSFTTQGPGTQVSGIISTDTTWTLVNSPYIVTNDVTIKNGVTLTIEPGVVVKFDDVYYLYVDGILKAGGTNASLITFTSNKLTPQAGDWGGIKLRATSDDSQNVLNYIAVKYAQNGFYLDAASPTITNSTISENNNGIYCSWSDAGPTITNNILKNNTAAGVDCTSYGSKQITKNFFSNNGYGIKFPSGITTDNIVINNNYGIYIDSGGGYGLGEIRRNIIANNSRSGVYIFGYSVSTSTSISYNLIYGNGSGGSTNDYNGFYFKDFQGTISYNTIKSNTNGIYNNAGSYESQ